MRPIATDVAVLRVLCKTDEPIVSRFRRGRLTWAQWTIALGPDPPGRDTFDGHVRRT